MGADTPLWQTLEEVLVLLYTEPGSSAHFFALSPGPQFMEWDYSHLTVQGMALPIFKVGLPISINLT